MEVYALDESGALAAATAAVAIAATKAAAAVAQAIAATLVEAAAVVAIAATLARAAVTVTVTVTVIVIAIVPVREAAAAAATVTVISFAIVTVAVASAARNPIASPISWAPNLNSFRRPSPFSRKILKHKHKVQNQIYIIEFEYTEYIKQTVSKPQ